MKTVTGLFAVLAITVGFTCSSFASQSADIIEEAQARLGQSNLIAGCGAKADVCRTESDFKKANNILAVSCTDSFRRMEFVRLPYNRTVSGSYKFKKGPRNGVNTRFSVKNHKGCTVLATQRATRDIKWGFKEVVYTAYSPEIDTEEMREIGLKYVMGVVDGAQRDLKNKGVMSQAFQRNLVSSVAQSELAMRLAIVEHIDPARVKHESYQQLVNEVLVVLAANKVNAYKYSVSSANARALFQFTPGTYKAVGRLYPSAGLEKEFVSGAQDHLNAAKAALLLFDSDMALLSTQKKETLVHNMGPCMEYLAAAYNSGSLRARKAMGDDCIVQVSRLLPETQGYISKLRNVNDTLYSMSVNSAQYLYEQGATLQVAYAGDKTHFKYMPGGLQIAAHEEMFHIAFINALSQYTTT